MLAAFEQRGIMLRKFIEKQGIKYLKWVFKHFLWLLHSKVYWLIYMLLILAAQRRGSLFVARRKACEQSEDSRSYGYVSSTYQPFRVLLF